MSSTYWFAVLTAALIVPTPLMVISVTLSSIQKNAAAKKISDTSANTPLIVFPLTREKIISTTPTMRRANATYLPASSMARPPFDVLHHDLHLVSLASPHNLAMSTPNRDVSVSAI